MHEPNRGKKPHKFTYTYKDISRLTGLTIGTLYKYHARGKLNPSNLSDVLRFVNLYKPASA